MLPMTFVTIFEFTFLSEEYCPHEIHFERKPAEHY